MLPAVSRFGGLGDRYGRWSGVTGRALCHSTNTAQVAEGARRLITIVGKFAITIVITPVIVFYDTLGTV